MWTSFEATIKPTTGTHKQREISSVYLLLCWLESPHRFHMGHTPWPGHSWPRLHNKWFQRSAYSITGPLDSQKCLIRIKASARPCTPIQWGDGVIRQACLCANRFRKEMTLMNSKTNILYQRTHSQFSHTIPIIPMITWWLEDYDQLLPPWISIISNKQRIYSYLWDRVVVNINNFIQISDNDFGDFSQLCKVICVFWYWHTYSGPGKPSYRLQPRIWRKRSRNHMILFHWHYPVNL